MSRRLSDLLLRSQSDERLVSLARAGQDRAFAAIVERYRPELLALARQLTSDGRAEDLLQQAFLSAFAALRSGAEVRHLRGWLYQIVRNAASKARPTADLALDQVENAGEPLEETVLRRARALAAMSELARLPERQRGALVATALGDRAHAEVAHSMGISEQAVRQLVHRARTTLRRAVTGVTPWPVAKWVTTAPSGASGPEIAAGVGAVSSTGVAMKLGVLFAATGVLATGVAIGPVRQVHDKGAGGPPVSHRPHTPARDAALSSPSVEATMMPRASPNAAATGPPTWSRSRGPAAVSRPTHGSRLTAVATTNARGTAVEDLAAEHPGDASGAERETTGSPANERQSGTNSSEGAASSGHDGQTASGSTAQAGSDSGGARSGTDVSPIPDASKSGGAVTTGDSDTASTSDDPSGVTPVVPSAPASGTSAAGGDPGIGSSSSDGGESAQSRSGPDSDSTVSDTSREGK